MGFGDCDALGVELTETRRTLAQLGAHKTCWTLKKGFTLIVTHISRAAEGLIG